jgi:hypothetical protein
MVGKHYVQSRVFLWQALRGWVVIVVGTRWALDFGVKLADFPGFGTKL